MTARSTIPLVLLLIVGLAGRSLTAPPPGPAPATTTTTPVPDHYVLGPGDQIEINVFGEPDLGRTVTIKPDGIIALPLINQVQAAGKTAAQLEAALANMYGKYLKAPLVSVLVRQFRMDPVYVMGEVSRPGRYDLVHEMTFLDALSLAGGATEKANLDGVQIVRVENGKSKSIPVKGNQMIQGKEAIPNPKLQSGDLVFIPKRGMGIMDILNHISILRMILGL